MTTKIIVGIVAALLAAIVFARIPTAEAQVIPAAVTIPPVVLTCTLTIPPALILAVVGMILSALGFGGATAILAALGIGTTVVVLGALGIGTVILGIGAAAAFLIVLGIEAAIWGIEAVITMISVLGASGIRVAVVFASVLATVVYEMCKSLIENPPETSEIEELVASLKTEIVIELKNIHWKFTEEIDCLIIDLKNLIREFTEEVDGIPESG
jgi:hypothetical protein